MAETLLAAVVERFDAELAVDVPGGLHFGLEPEQRVMPFAVMLHEGSTFDYTTEPGEVESALVSLTVFQVGLRETELLARKVHAAFDWQSLPLAFGDLRDLSVRKAGYQVQRDEYLSPDGRPVYRAKTTYAVTVSRSEGP